MAKIIAFDQEAREAIRRGISKLARAVKVTLGPKGRHPCRSFNRFTLSATPEIPGCARMLR